MSSQRKWKDPIDPVIYGHLSANPPKSFMLYAGAGSGKTSTLVEVLDALRESHGRTLSLTGKQIAVVTYTNAACDEIRERLKHDSAFHVSTIHSFSWELIRGFTDDIRIWLDNKLATDIHGLEIDIKKARNPQGVTVQKNIKKRDGKIKRLDEIRKVKTFSYTPNSFSDEIGALNHSEVVSLAAYFLASEPLMAEIFINKYPLFLIDETQDTNEELLNSIIAVQQLFPNNFCVGLFGDTMQRIYGGGKTDLKETLPKSWLTPEKKINHRCPKRVITLINKIRLEDDPHQQDPKPTAEEGQALIFIADANKAISKPDLEEKIRNKMAELTDDKAWETRNHVKTLILEHHMAALRGGFDKFFLPLLAIDRLKEAALNGEGKEITFLLSVILPLVDAILRKNDFDVATVFRGYSPLLSATHLKNSVDPLVEIEIAELAVEALRKKIEDAPNFTIIELLRMIDGKCLFAIPETFRPHLINLEALGEEPIEDAELEDNESQAWGAALTAPIGELAKYATYQSDASDFGTHQGVKGLQYERVMVILDDEEARGFMFSYEKLLGAAKLTDQDVKNEREGKDSSPKRSRRLFYVTCSRTKKSLAVVAYTKNPAAVRSYVVDSGWFSKGEVIELA